MNAGAPALADPSGRFGRFEISAPQRQLHVDGAPVPLGGRAFDLLLALVARRDRVVSKDELMEVVWPGLFVEENNLQVQISALRKLLGPQAIATVAGRGYRFTVAETGVAAVPPTPRVRERGDGVRKSRLLVADDNKVNRLLLCRSLELMGHEVASADNGRLALDRLRAEAFDLLLLDLEMPEIDGFALLEQRAADPALQAVAVIVTSSLEGTNPVVRCLELGADDYLHKPVNPVLLKARVESSLERKHLRDRQRELLARLAPGMDVALPPGAPGPGRFIEATVLVAGLHGVDALAAVLAPHETLELLGHGATLMVDAVEGQGGFVSRFDGDRLVALFCAPAMADAAQSAVRAAREMADLIAQFNAERATGGNAPVALGIGLATGPVLTGPAGTARRTAHVCIGSASQRAERLEAESADGGTRVLLDDATQAVLQGGAPDASDHL